MGAIWIANEPLELIGLRIQYLYLSSELARYCELPGQQGNRMIVHLTAKMTGIFSQMAKYLL